MQKLKLKIYLIISVFGLFFISQKTHAATYYICDTAASCNVQSGGWNTGNDSNTCNSKSTPCKTIRAGADKLSAGDTLIIGDGNYTGQQNMLSTDWSYDLVSGTGSGYTIIRGENYLGAVIDGQNQYNPIQIDNESYMIFENLYLRNPNLNLGGASAFRAENSNHIKVLKCAAENGHGKFWFRYCNHILVEDSIAWGKGTYYYFFGGEYGDYTRSQYNIVRRSVARRDCHRGSAGGNHYSSFVSYWADNTYFQNDISIDAENIDCGDMNYPIYTMAVFYTANGSSNYNATGCISINDKGQIGQFESGASPVALRDNSIILNSSGSTTGVLTYGNSVVLENNTFGQVRGSGDWMGIGVGEVSGALQSVRNNIIYGCRYGLGDVSGNHSFNVLYNDSNYQYTSAGTGELTNQNPLSSGLMFPCRVESGSFLASVGQNGNRAGAEIIKKVGVSGTLYGEAGWNQVTNEELWPWPNEEKIKELMGSYIGSYMDNGSQFVSVNGQRGFCAGTSKDGSTQTLTKYIWEYLGNQIPAEVYGGSGDSTAPESPSGLQGR